MPTALTHAECPDCGATMRLENDCQHGDVFTCSASCGSDPLSHRDIYLEHDETWSIHDGLLMIERLA